MTLREIGKSVSDAVVKQVGRATSRLQESRSLAADILESDDAFLVVFDAPGATASDLQVRYVDDRVEVRLDRFREFYDDYEMTYPGRGLALDGSVTLPEDAVVDAETVTATLKGNGTLHVEIPKAEADEPIAEQTAHDAGEDADTAADAEADDADETEE